MPAFQNFHPFKIVGPTVFAQNVLMACRHFIKVKKISVSKQVVAVAVNNLIQKCVHVPIKHSSTDFIIFMPNVYEHR